MNRTSRRFKGLGNGTEYFHCVSRVGDRRMVLKQREKEEFIRIMRLYEGVYALRILSYCLMTNHFHILLEVPKRPPQLELPDDGALVTRVSAALGDMAGRGLREELLRLRKAGMDSAREALRERYFSLMWDVSSFMQVVKQRFTQWYNRSRSKRRRGTLWEDRFRSVLVAGEADALKAMAVYIDLNPVRAGIVKDPADYRWSSYGEAMGGGEKAVAGLAWIGGLVAHGGGNRNFAAREGDLSAHHRLAGGGGNRNLAAREGMETYRCVLFGQAEERTDGAGRVVKRGADAGKIKEVLGNRGRVPMREFLRRRVRYFTDGAVIGSKGFLEEVFARTRGRLGGKRKDGARRLRGLSEKMYALRDLQSD